MSIDCFWPGETVKGHIINLTSLTVLRLTKVLSQNEGILADLKVQDYPFNNINWCQNCRVS
jgi:hypothetical protein